MKLGCELTEEKSLEIFLVYLNLLGRIMESRCCLTTRHLDPTI